MKKRASKVPVTSDILSFAANYNMRKAIIIVIITSLAVTIINEAIAVYFYNLFHAARDMTPSQIVDLVLWKSYCRIINSVLFFFLLFFVLKRFTKINGRGILIFCLFDLCLNLVALRYY